MLTAADRDQLAVDGIKYAESAARRLRKVASKRGKTTEELYTMSFDDMVGAGTLGVVQASRIYDPAEHGEWLDFALSKARSAIMHEIRDGALIKQPQRSAKQILQLDTATQNAITEQTRTCPIPDDFDTAEESSHEAAVDTKEQVQHLLGRLNGSDRELIELHYLRGLTHEQIAAQRNITRRAVGYAIDAALHKMRTLTYCDCADCGVMMLGDSWRNWYAGLRPAEQVKHPAPVAARVNDRPYCESCHRELHAIHAA